MDELALSAILFLVLYFLPALIYIAKSDNNLLGKMTFALGVLLIGWTVIGWLLMIRVAVNES
jgi:uncharacterized integral membrane protein